MILEIGPGYTLSGKGYRFNPKVCPSDNVVYLDIQPPRFACSDWVVGDAQMLPFRSNAFETIYASHVIEHLEDPEMFLRECHRVLRRGGRLFVYTPNFLSRNARADPDHKHVFTVFSLSRLLRSAGFRVRYPGTNIGSLLPKFVRMFIKALLYILSDELRIVGEKM